MTNDTSVASRAISITQPVYRRLIYAAAFSSFLTAISAVAAAGEPHIHGVADLEIAIDGSELQLVLRGPAEVFFGFEHEPQTPDEHREVAEALADLRDPAASLITLAPDCDLEMVAVDTPFSSNALAAAPTHDHTNGHQAGSGHGMEFHQSAHQGAEPHKNLEASYTYACPSGPPRKVTLEAFVRFPALQRINTVWITDDGAGSSELTAENSVVTPVKP